MSVDQIRMMKEDESILISGRQAPVKIKIPPYFNDRKLHRLTKTK